MKWLFYSPVDLRAGLGCERWHCDVTASLRRQFGDSVAVVTGNLGIIRWSDTYLTGELQGTPYTRLNFPVMMASIIPDPLNIFRLWTRMQSADVVHFIAGFAGQDILMALLKLLTGKRVIVGHHAPMFHFSRFHNWYIRHVSRHVFKLFDAHMTLNRSDLHVLTGWGIANVHFIPSGVRVEKFLRLPRRSHSKLNFLSVGRYDTPQKGFDLAVAAIARFNNRHPKNQAVFHFAGSAPGPTAIDRAAAAEPNVINHGFTPYEHMPDLYQSSDVFLLSSREEPFGLILIEAWASGLPVLATRTEGPRDMLLPDRNGWFIKDVSVEGILRAIEQVYSAWSKSPHKFLDMEHDCRSTGRRYNIDATAAHMRELLGS